jgi:mannitol-specific phosphotransferase system IIBC component
MEANNNAGTLTATLGGTMLTIAVHIASEDILKTVILAALGAVVSYIVSLLLRRLFRRKSDDLIRRRR